MSQIFQIPAEPTKITTLRNDAIRIQFDSQENISAESAKRVLEWRNKLGWLLFAVREKEFEAGDLLTLPEIKTVEQGELRPSEKQRRALHVLWTKVPEGFKTDEEHYKYYMEKIRQWILEKIPKE